MNEHTKKFVADVRNESVVIENRPDSASRSMNPAAARDAVIRAISAWEGVTVREHRFGGVEFRLGRRELGHIHATFADLPFPKTVRDELVDTGRVRPHHILPESGWVTAPMRSPVEVAGVIQLFRQNYERAAGIQR